MKKALLNLVSVVIVLLFIAGCVSSCGDVAGTDDTNASADSTAETSTQAEESTGEMHGVPDTVKYTGEEFRVLYRNANYYRDDFFADSVTGEIVNDSVYARNTAAMERFGMTLKLIAGDQDSKTFCSNIETKISGGDDLYDLISAYQAYTVPLALKGIFANLKDTEYLDYSKPWWELDYMRELLIKNDDAIYFIQGDIALYMLGSMGSIYYNKSLLKSNNGDDFNINSIVSAGEWTLDKFYDLTKNVYVDTNGDSQKDESDIYGFASTTVKNTEHFMYDAGIVSCTRDADGYPTYTFGDARSTDFIDKLYRIFYENEGAYIVTSDSSISTTQNMFKAEKLLFLPGWLYMAKDLSANSAADYGIIPYPKLDTEQAEYKTLVHDGTTIYCVPVTAKDLTKISAVTEVLCYESWKQVTPNYYDVALKFKYTNDSESAAMIDTIRAGITTDYFYANNYSFSGNPGLLCRTAMQSKLRTITAQIKTSQKTTNAKLKQLIADYKASKSN